MRIALDAMGGDYAPAEIIKGALESTRQFPVKIILVGDEKKIKAELSKHKQSENIALVHAPEFIGMDESPASAVRNKKQASINIAVKLLKDRDVDAVISAGNTGAFMAAALFTLGRIEGIERPAIATIFPTVKKTSVLLLDMGANVDCRPKHLAQFAEMGAVYASQVLHMEKPRIGLLNIGKEKEKGNELTSAAYPLLQQTNLNFAGHVEPDEILSGNIDVVVCDGFVGNIILKFGESSSHAILSLLKEELEKSLTNKIGALFLKSAFLNLKKRIDYDEYGGAPLLGINGICIKAHGRAKAVAIKNAVGAAMDAIRGNIVENISVGIRKER